MAAETGQLSEKHRKIREQQIKNHETTMPAATSDASLAPRAFRKAPGLDFGDFGRSPGIILGAKIEENSHHNVKRIFEAILTAKMQNVGIGPRPRRAS